MLLVSLVKTLIKVFQKKKKSRLLGRTTLINSSPTTQGHLLVRNEFYHQMADICQTASSYSLTHF